MYRNVAEELEALEAAFSERSAEEVRAAEESDERLTEARSFLAHVKEQLERLSDAVRHLHFESGPPAVPLSELSLIEVMESRG